MIRRRCKCGCDRLTNYGKKYVYGHNRKGKIGIKFTEEHKRKISLALIGNTNKRGTKVSDETRKRLSNSHKGQKSWNKDKTGIYSEKTKKRMSLAHIGKKFSEEHKRNISINMMKCRTDGYCDAWGDKEYKDDLRKDECSDCGMTTEESLFEWGQRLGLHHKDGNKENCHPDNIDTLCRSCHAIADWELRKETNL